MTTNNKSLNSLFLMVFASQSLISMPPKERDTFIVTASHGALNLDFVNPLAIGAAAVLPIPGNPNNGYISAFPQTKSELLTIISRKIREIEHECSIMASRRTRTEFEKPANISSFLDVLGKDIILCQDTCQKLVEKQVIISLIGDELLTEPIIIGFATQVFEIVNNFSAQHQININIFNGLCRQPNLDKNPHQANKFAEGLKQKFNANKIKQRRDALFGQTQAPQTEVTMTEEERIELIKELCGDESEQTKTDKPKASSRAPKSKKSK